MNYLKHPVEIQIRFSEAVCYRTVRFNVCYIIFSLASQKKVGQSSKSYKHLLHWHVKLLHTGQNIIDKHNTKQPISSYQTVVWLIAGQKQVYMLITLRLLLWNSLCCMCMQSKGRIFDNQLLVACHQYAPVFCWQWCVWRRCVMVGVSCQSRSRQTSLRFYRWTWVKQNFRLVDTLQKKKRVTKPTWWEWQYI